MNLPLSKLRSVGPWKPGFHNAPNKNFLILVYTQTRRFDIFLKVIF